MLSAYAKAIILITLFGSIHQLLTVYIQIEDFYAHSFVPNEIIVAYGIDNGNAINFNLSVLNQFPGKLLMHIFVRQLANEPGGQWSNELFKLKNMDFCKMLKSLRNLTTEQIQGDSILPPTFLISCPLKPGFYFVRDGRFDVSILPIRIPNGRYLVQFELIQVYEEVIKLLSCKIKCKKDTPPEENAANQTTTFTWSDEEEDKASPHEAKKKGTKLSNENQPQETEIQVEVGSGEVGNDEEEEDVGREEEEEQEAEQGSDSSMDY